MQLAFYNKAYLKSSYSYKANLKTQQVYILLKSLKVHMSLGSVTPLIQRWIAEVAQKLITLTFEDRTLIKAVKVSWFIDVSVEFFNWFMVENARLHFAVLGDRVIRRSIKTRHGDISILEKTSRVLYIFHVASRWRRIGHCSMILCLRGNDESNLPENGRLYCHCLLYTSPSPRDA